jgi:hypothetical protein
LMFLSPPSIPYSPSTLNYWRVSVSFILAERATLGRFNAAVLAAESQIAIALEKRRGSAALLCEGGNRRELRHWEDADGNAVDVTVDLLRGTRWLGRIASDALVRCPNPTTSDRIEEVFGEIRPINKLHAGFAIIDLDDNVLARATRWEQSTDPFTRQLAAWWFAHHQSDTFAGEHLERAFLDSDRGVRTIAVQGLGGKTLSKSLQKRLQALVSQDAPVGYACVHCGTANPADRTSCAKCNIVGPDLKAAVQKVIDPGSTSVSEDDKDEN